MPVAEILTHINNEDKTVPYAIEKMIPQIERLVVVAVDKMLAGGRLFYIGAGTSGRLAIVDASECPPPMVCRPTWLLVLLPAEKKR